ncbi:MAG: hypothetical protein DCC67_14535 [Planctomycetota bacterium]|nr:MAG: hypothetical protein DCC67_14535 [Planctomycetota bacterium]
MTLNASNRWNTRRWIALATFGLAQLLVGSEAAHATGDVALALDGMIVNNTGGGQPGWIGFGRFVYGSMTVGPSATLGRYGAFTVSEPGTGGSGVGVNFAMGSPAIDSPRDSFSGPITPVTSAMFPLLDRATFGVNFDPTQYVAELVYKPLAGNTATQLNVTVDSTDGFDASGARSGEQWQWGFLGLVDAFNTATKDADGFATVRSNGGALTTASSTFDGVSHMYQSGTPSGDDSPDFNDFEGGPLPVPNGVVQIHLQTVYGANAALVDNWEIKALRLVKIAPDAREVARLDGRSGFSLRFGTPFQRNPDTLINIGGVDYDPPVTDQVSRFDQNGFTNIVLNTDDDEGIGGLALWQSAATTVFDGNDASVEVKARLTAPLGAGQADHIVLVVKDKDGNDTGSAGDFGGDEYHFNLDLSQFNTASMTTVSIPLSSFTAQIGQEFANPGDGLLSDFNLYYLGLQTDAGAGLVDLEIESLRVLLSGSPGDFDGDGDVDGNDFLVWQRNAGSSAELADWKANFGAGGGAVGAVPEPGALVLVALGVVGGLSLRRRQAR